MFFFKQEKGIRNRQERKTSNKTQYQKIKKKQKCNYLQKNEHPHQKRKDSSNLSVTEYLEMEEKYLLFKPLISLSTD